MGGGLSGALYEYLFSQKIVKRVPHQQGSFLFASFLFLLSVISSFALFYIVGISPFHSSIIGLVTPLSLLFIKRRDLMLQSTLIGLFFVAFAFPQYWFLFSLDPSAILWWDFTQVSNIRILTAPLVDLVWFFFIGMFMGVLYPVMEDSQIVSQ